MKYVAGHIAHIPYTIEMEVAFETEGANKSVPRRRKMATAHKQPGLVEFGVLK
jgi:hypothetical protein